MNYQVVILSGDAVFARMLELEFRSRLRVLVTAAPEEKDSTELLILDLDSAVAPEAGYYRRMIGFSRHSARSAPDAMRCSMILRRPFRMSQLRHEVYSELGEGGIPEEPTPIRMLSGRRSLSLDPENRTLRCDQRLLSFSPQEFRLLQCLVEHRGKAVSREELAQVIGSSETNKTDVYICYLRRKTDALPRGRLIRTVRGKGYCIE